MPTEFKEPILSKKVVFDEKRYSEYVRGFVISHPDLADGHTERTREFFIKQLDQETFKSLRYIHRVYFEDENRLQYTAYLRKDYRNKYHKDPSPQELALFITEHPRYNMERDFLVSTEGELREYFENALHLLKPETILKYGRMLYSYLKDLYPNLPDFIVEQHFFILQGHDGYPHAYAVSPNIYEGSIKGELLLGPTFMSLPIWNEYSLRQMGFGANEELIRNEVAQIANMFKQYLNNDQVCIRRLVNQINNFVRNSKENLRMETKIIDFFNVAVTPDGKLRMFDLGAVYPTIEFGGKSQVVKNFENLVEIIDLVAKELSK